MRRCEFLLHAAGLAAGLLLPRRGGAQGSTPPGSPREPFPKSPMPPDFIERPAGPAVTLAVAGDTTLGYNLQNHVDEIPGVRCKEHVWPLYPRGVREVLDSADLALVNLECPFTERGEKLPRTSTSARAPNW